MKQVTTKQHYLPRYRLQHFLRSNNKYYVYSNGTNPNRRDRETGKNDSSFALCDKLYELTEVHSWTKHENLIETNLLANDVEPEDAGEIKKAINSIKANTKLSLSDSEWLGKYALRMLYRSPAYMIQLYRVRDIAFKQSFYERLCRVGSIHLCSTDAMTPEIDIRRIKNPRDVKEVLSKTIEACRKANGIRTSEIIGDHGRFPEPDPHGMPPEPCHEHPHD